MSRSSTARVRAVALAAALAAPLALTGLGGEAARAATAACPTTIPTGVFTDVPASDTFAAAVDCAAYWGVTTGSADGRYVPTGAVTRDQMASFVARTIRVSGGSLPAGSAVFADVTGNAHAADIEALAAAHVVNGTAAGRYTPGRVVTRNQMAAFLVRAYDYRTGTSLPAGSASFPDVAGDPFAAEIAAAAAAGFAGGYRDGTYRPTAPVTREQMAAFLTRVLDPLVADGLAQVPSHTALPPRTPAPLPSVGFPVRLAFYYPFYPEGFVNPGSHYHPSDGAYRSDDPAELARQVRAMRYAGMNGAIFSWWGQGHPFSARLSVALDAAHGTPFRWSAYYEPEGQGNPSAGQIADDLSYLYAHAAGDPNWLRIGGKPVIFVWPDASDGCAMLDRWAAANANHRWYVVQKVFYSPRYSTCAHQPDAWHQYAPAERAVQVGSSSYSVSPGFWRHGEAVTLPRSVSAFDAAVRAMKASGAHFQLVTTWNEWIEDTAVESAAEWASASGYGAYVDVLHRELGSR